eukprot:m.6235 g.6235  ORF g.6235 m.6235 type:complete len:64 (+) comp4812_c0_seq1:243-434(+)
MLQQGLSHINRSYAFSLSNILLISAMFSRYSMYKVVSIAITLFFAGDVFNLLLQEELILSSTI